MAESDALSFACPICRALPGENCESNASGFRYPPHVERQWAADDPGLGCVLTEIIVLAEVPKRWGPQTWRE
jgi:hypothetical protein